MGWLDKAVDKVGDVGRGAFEGVKNSIDQITDSTGDLIRAAGRGDIESVFNDALSIGWEVGNIVSFGMNNQLADEFRRLVGKLIPEIDYQDRKVMSRDATAPMRIIYGRARTGGVCRYIEKSGADSEYLHLILVFAGHSCAEIEQVYFGSDLAFIGTTPQGKFAGYATAIFEHGKQTAANAAIVADTPAGWTSEHKLLGCTYAYFKLKYSNDVFNGVPNISAVIKGKDDILDLRTSTTGWTDNHALCVYDYMTIEDGLGLSTSDLNAASFIHGANVSDELVSSGVGLTERRYKVNGSLTVSGNPIDKLNELLATGSAYTTRTNNVFSYVAGEYVPPGVADDFTEYDLIGGINLAPVGEKSSRINSISGTFIDPNSEYEETEFVPIIVNQYITDDKEELEASTKFQFANTSTHCRRLAKISLEASRYGLTADVQVNYRGLDYVIGDRITMTISSLGWNKKIFRIEDIQFSLSDGVKFVLREDSPLIWEWDEGDALVVVAPPALDLPDPSIVSIPTSFGAVESLYIANDKKTIRSRLTFTWDGSTVINRYELQGKYDGESWRVMSDFIATPTFTFDDAQIGDWQFRLRAINQIGFKSDWNYIDVLTQGKSAPPANVSGFVAKVKPFGIEVEWLPIPDVDLDYYEIRLGSDWNTATFIQRIYATRWTWETRPVGSETLIIKAVDTSGNESVSAQPALMLIQNPKQVTITPSVIDNNVLLRWTDATTSFSIDKYEVRRGNTFNGAELVGTVSATFANAFETEAGIYTYWVQAIDIAGNKGEPAFTTANVDQPPDFTLLANFAFDLTAATAVNMISDTIPAEFTFDSEEITFDSDLFTFDSMPAVAWIGPFTTGQTWADHFAGYATYADFIAAGYDYFLQPTPSSASFEQVHDFGAAIGISRIRASVRTGVIAGSPVIKWYIGYSSDGITYDEAESLDRVATGFRYVKIRAEITSATGLDLMSISGVALRLDVKVRTDQGFGDAVSTDSGGTVVYFNQAFADIQSIVVTPQGTTALIPVFDFVDAPNPTQFTVYLFNTSGVRVSAPFSWTVRGV